MAPRRPAKKDVSEKVAWEDDKHCWTVRYGQLRPGKGRLKERLFKVAAEKLPYGSLSAVKKHLRDKCPGFGDEGVYIVHDSMGCPRYIGRGNIFERLKVHKKEHPHELEYFSFYVVTDKMHEREIETLLIRAAGPLLEFNVNKKWVGIAAASIRDFEAGTLFYVRQHKKGKKS